jgi:hypothetical protein
MRLRRIERQDAKNAKEKTPGNQFLAFLLGALGVLATLALTHFIFAQPLYSNDFKKAPDGDPPEEIDVLNGTFAIKTIDGNKTIEVPSDPVDAYGALFGPDNETDLRVEATIVATATGKRTPEFGIGLGGANGYRLWLMPATSQLQIIKGEEVVASVPFTWKSGVTTTLQLQARKAGDQTIVEGKAWLKGETEPKDWTVKFTDKAEAPKGRPSIWGSPYSSTPIRFTDLIASRTGQR